MSNRIDLSFERLKAQGRKALIPFITAGDPDLATSEKLVVAMAEAGADVIELGVPFSDPMADGPVIQASSERALAKGTTLKKIMKSVEKLRKKTQVPLVLMGYANPIYKMGLSAFADAAAAAGVDAVLTVDMPIEESEEYRRVLKERGMHPIFLLAPTSSFQRVKMIERVGSGFVYYVSMTGVTGAALSVNDRLKTHLAETRRELTWPLCVGFGISEPKAAKQIAALADGVVVGSALIQLMSKEKSAAQKIKKAVRFIESLRKAV